MTAPRMPVPPPPRAGVPDDATPGRREAILAESLYLGNLLIAPGICFAALIWLWLRVRRQPGGGPPLARNHLAQTFAGTLWAAALLVALNAAILVIGGFDSMWSWLAVIMYFTFFHSALVLCGMLGLAKALAGRPCVYPLIGPREAP